jgi:hypothetical protein
LVLLLVVAVGACGSSAPERTVHLSRTATYGSFRAMAHDAVAVVEVAVEGNGAAETLGGLPFTVTEARVTEVVRGRLDTDVVRLRQLGSSQSSGGLVPEGELVKAGERYVAFVVPFTFADGRPTGQHVVLGAWQGLYRVQGSELVATDKVPSALPKRLSKASLRTALG